MEHGCPHGEGFVGDVDPLADDGFVGPVNVTSPGAVTQGEFVRALGDLLGRPAFLPTPAWLLRMALGEFAAEILTSKKVLPARALAAAKPVCSAK